MTLTELQKISKQLELYSSTKNWQEMSKVYQKFLDDKSPKPMQMEMFNVFTSVDFWEWIIENTSLPTPWSAK